MTDSVQAIPKPRTIARGIALLLMFLTLPLRALGIEQEPPLKVALVGDSTVCEHPADSPVRGWGEMIKSRFRPRVHLINYSREGGSTKSFLDKGTWLSVVRCRPSIVLIQFGIKDRDEVSIDEFKSNLGAFISVARRMGSTPILVTPPCPRAFTADGRLKAPKNKYVEAIRKVGNKSKVPVIDLQASSAALYTQLGAEDSAALASSPSDDILFNLPGATAIAELVLRDLPTVEPRLRREIIQRFPIEDTIAAQ